MLDCDNTHSDNPTEWVTPEQVGSAMVGLQFYICCSRYNGKVKDGRCPRPKFQVYFPIDIVTDAKEYSSLKKRVISEFPHLHFDTNAKDSARMFFGVQNPQVLMVGGDEG